MNLETMRVKKEMIMMEIERDQDELRSAFRDLSTSVSLSEKVSTHHKTWLFGALIAGLVIGQLE